ncbi:MAG: hypothetical protein R2785_03415 [Flavobacteriaceae bacterium]
MKTQIKIALLLSFVLGALSTSCRTEEMELIQSPPEDTLVPDSVVASLMSQTTLNDGSNDNIIDNANCFNIQLPVTVIVNGIEIVVNSEDDYDDIEDIFDEFDDDSDTLEITFPITIILSDFTEIVINNYTEFYSYVNGCNGENESDDDIECLDFVYPISASVYNSNNEIILTITFNNDYELHEFIEDFDESDIVSINFPITVVLLDGTEIVIDSLTELQDIIELYDDYCDEDDDYDYNDDDCNDCDTNQLETILTGCSDWYVDKLERNGNDYDDVYDGYLFNFFNDGTLSVSWGMTTVYGTWEASGTGNNILVVIDVPALPYCNNNWYLHEIEQYSNETKVDFRVGDDDRLRYENNNCN